MVINWRRSRNRSFAVPVVDGLVPGTDSATNKSDPNKQKYLKLAPVTKIKIFKKKKQKNPKQNKNCVNETKSKKQDYFLLFF